MRSIYNAIVKCFQNAVQKPNAKFRTKYVSAKQ